MCVLHKVRPFLGPNSAAAYVPAYTSVTLGDLYAFDVEAAAWADLTAVATGDIPVPRAGHGFVEDGDLIYVHGGFSAETGLVPRPFLQPVVFASQSLSMLCCPYNTGSRARAALRGAHLWPGTFLADLVVLDPDTLLWTTRTVGASANSAPPSPRMLHGFAATGGRLYVYGGCVVDVGSNGEKQCRAEAVRAAILHALA